MVYDVGPMSNHWRRMLLKQIRCFMMLTTLHPNKK